MKTPEDFFDEFLKAAKLPQRTKTFPVGFEDYFLVEKLTLNDRLAHVQSITIPGREIPISADFINAATCNACAFPGDFANGSAVIVFHRGAIQLLADVFMRMLSHPNVMSERFGGDETADARHTEGLCANYDLLSALRTSQNRIPFPESPLNKDRRSIAVVCFHMAFGFIALHEIVHIAHGHIAYLVEKAKKQGNWRHPINPIPVFQQSAVSGDILDLQTLEMWADEVAASIIVRGMLMRSRDAIISQLFPKPEEKLQLWAFAMFTLCRLWGFKTTIKEMESGEHPPVTMRFHELMLNAGEAIAALFAISKEKSFLLIKAGADEAELAIRHCGEPPLKASDIIAVTHPAAVEHRARLADHFNNVLLPLVKPLSLIPLDNPTDVAAALQPQPQTPPAAVP